MNSNNSNTSNISNSNILSRYNLNLYDMYKEPLNITKTKDQYCYDENGKRYLDLYNNVYHVGYCNEIIANAVYEQMTTCVTNTRYSHHLIGDYAKELLSTFPPELGFDTCYFVNSGSEANDLALRIARSHLGVKNNIISLRGGYHGTTDLCTSVSSVLSTGNNNNEYTYNVSINNDKVFILNLHNDDKINNEILDDYRVLIHETIQGVAGQLTFKEDKLSNLYNDIKKYGGLCIADEVQSGFGRTGTHFWAFQYENIVPDFVTLGKSIGNGFPLGCVVTRKELCTRLGPYFNTYGGNPVSMIAGLTTLKIIKDNNLQNNSNELGTWLKENLISNNFKVSGRGLFLGIHLDSKSATYIHEDMLKKGYLLGIGGSDRHIIRIKPPMIIKKGDLINFLKDFINSYNEYLEH
jgi:4-aminobutyrate aminotransferase-like enzyme